MGGSLCVVLKLSLGAGLSSELAAGRQGQVNMSFRVARLG